jgi:hypothetical protein
MREALTCTDESNKIEVTRMVFVFTTTLQVSPAIEQPRIATAGRLLHGVDVSARLNAKLAALFRFAGAFGIPAKAAVRRIGILFGLHNPGPTCQNTTVTNDMLYLSKDIYLNRIMDSFCSLL